MPVVKVIRAVEGVGPQISPSLLPVVKKVKNKIKSNAVPTPEKIPEPVKPVKKLLKKSDGAPTYVFPQYTAPPPNVTAPALASDSDSD